VRRKILSEECAAPFINCKQFGRIAHGHHTAAASHTPASELPSSTVISTRPEVAQGAPPVPVAALARLSRNDRRSRLRRRVLSGRQPQCPRATDAWRRTACRWFGPRLHAYQLLDAWDLDFGVLQPLTRRWALRNHDYAAALSAGGSTTGRFAEKNGSDPEPRLRSGLVCLRSPRAGREEIDVSATPRLRPGHARHSAPASQLDAQVTGRCSRPPWPTICRSGCTSGARVGRRLPVPAGPRCTSRTTRAVDGVSAQVISLNL